MYHTLHPYPVLEKGTRESTGLISPEHLRMAYFGIQEFTHKYVKMFLFIVPLVPLQTLDTNRL